MSSIGREAVAVGAQAETIVGMDESEDQALSWVLMEKWW